MKGKKRYLVLLLALGVLVTVVSVAFVATAVSAPSTQTAAMDAALAPASVPRVTASADFAVLYKDLGQLKQAAALVVRGEVTEVSYVDFNTTAYTKTTFKVSECLQGDVRPGDEITIAEVGGVTTMAAVNGDKFGAPTAQDEATKVEILLEGAPLSEVGDKCLYFLGIGSIGVVPGTYYVPLGAFQGRFSIRNGVAERFVPADWGGDYTSLAVAEEAIDQAVRRATLDK
jgi:hypothetical protein